MLARNWKLLLSAGTYGVTLVLKRICRKHLAERRGTVSRTLARSLINSVTEVHPASAAALTYCRARYYSQLKSFPAVSSELRNGITARK